MMHWLPVGIGLAGLVSMAWAMIMVWRVNRHWAPTALAAKRWRQHVADCKRGAQRANANKREAALMKQREMTAKLRSEIAARMAGL
jgi:hypothetical protein